MFDVTFINIAITGVIANITKSFSQSALGHMIYDGVRTLFTKEASKALHGEIVAVGLFTQLIIIVCPRTRKPLRNIWREWICPFPSRNWASKELRSS